VPDVWPRIHVIDGRGDVESFAHCLFLKVMVTEL
jgi:hypothetical protein